MAVSSSTVYRRTTRSAYPVLYEGEYFPVGGSKTLRATDADQVSLCASGAAVHHCGQAADQLAAVGVAARVIDRYPVEPIDAAALVTAAESRTGDWWSPRPLPARRPGSHCPRSPRRPAAPATRRPPGGALPTWLGYPVRAHGAAGSSPGHITAAHALLT
ncbi:transketolase C-terminal domain-containing protein [Streptomyces mexicanus]|uniref:transketolase C-terminal domain-containing protein n=1 Tax=Streptomyces mexicanus TaxID=178566 RepID=UPI0031EE9248